jgi:hypothetical protein
MFQYFNDMPVCQLLRNEDVRAMVYLHLIAHTNSLFVCLRVINALPSTTNGQAGQQGMGTIGSLEYLRPFGSSLPPKSHSSQVSDTAWGTLHINSLSIRSGSSRPEPLGGVGLFDTRRARRTLRPQSVMRLRGTAVSTPAQTGFPGKNPRRRGFQIELSDVSPMDRRCII